MEQPPDTRTGSGFPGGMVWDGVDDMSLETVVLNGGCLPITGWLL